MNFAGTPVAYLFDEALFNDLGQLWKAGNRESAEVRRHCLRPPTAVAGRLIQAPNAFPAPWSPDLPTDRGFAARSTSASRRPPLAASMALHAARRCGAVPCPSRRTRRTRCRNTGNVVACHHRTHRRRTALRIGSTVRRNILAPYCIY